MVDGIGGDLNQVLWLTDCQISLPCDGQVCRDSTVDGVSGFSFEFIQRDLRSDVLVSAVLVTLPVPTLEAALAEGAPHESALTLRLQDVLGDSFKVPFLIRLGLESLEDRLRLWVLACGQVFEL